MSKKLPVTLTVNGREVTRLAEPRMHLVDFLRSELGLTGSHLTCEHGVCGACTVKVDGAIVRGCLMLAVQADGSSVETVEGLSAAGALTPLQESFCARNALQCGFCTPGMLFAAEDLLAHGATPDRAAIRAALSGNYCRCTGYQSIVDAVEAAGGKSFEPLAPSPSAEGHIGQPAPRANARRLVLGAGTYVDDLVLPRLAHAAFLRSPYAHGRIVKIDVSAARSMPGVIGIATGAEIAAHCTPWTGVLSHLAGLKSAPQYPLALERACWRGEPVAILVAETRAEAEDAVERIEVEWRELPVVAEMETALDPATPVIHPELGDNLAFRREIDAGEVDAAFARAHKIVEATFHTGRHTGVCPEPRSILADWNPDGSLTVHHAGQSPHMMQAILSKHLAIEAHLVRVIAEDVGGSYGIKIHIYGDEIAAIVMSKLLRRPVKFVADRLESFLSDIHARDHRIQARMALDGDGKILAIAMDDLTGIGPYSTYPRTSAV
jgi:aerobic-type carbon monoxide dehydrogenase small subunit (CoxS/CutS family)